MVKFEGLRSEALVLVVNIEMNYFGRLLEQNEAETTAAILSGFPCKGSQAGQPTVVFGGLSS